MKAWSTEGENTTAGQVFVTCAGQSHDISGVEGLALVEKLKTIAKGAGFSKFDIYDSDNDPLSASDVEEGNFTGNLRIVKYNSAA